jgi:branched-chain amino acid transport system permease protein
VSTILRSLGWLGASLVIFTIIESILKTSKSYSLMGGDLITDYGLNIICLVGISIVLAVSLNLINGYTGQFSLGHAGFMAIGGYSAAFFAKTLAAGKNYGDFTLILILLGGLVCGALVSALAGLIVGIPSLRLKGDYLAIVTLGFGEIIRLTIENIDTVGGPRGYINIPKYPTITWLSAGAFQGTISNITWIYFFAIMTIIIVYNIVNSSFGRSLMAIRENEIAAEAMGINTAAYKVTAFTISAALAGVAGGLYAYFYGQLVPSTFNFVKSVEIVVMVVFGGMGSITGSVLGAVLLTMLPELLRSLSEYRMIVYSLLLIVIMLVRPQGILGQRELSLRWLFAPKNTPPPAS